ncbi:MAG: WG repeat-containing protein [Bacteroidales bacterium]|nr:WG repeat-containing protein [Bacteroidales bacterium]MDD4361425.1 WG repeat-containing protein [Bacteroidales bacterium]
MKKTFFILLGLLVLNTLVFAQNKNNSYVVHRDANGKLLMAEGIEHIYTNFNYWIVKINTDAKPAFNFKKAGTEKPIIKNKSEWVDEYVYGIIDTLGNFIFPPKFESINIMGDGVGIAKNYSNMGDNYYLIDMNRAIVKELDASYKLSLIAAGTVCFEKETAPYKYRQGFAKIDLGKEMLLDTILSVEKGSFDLGYCINGFYKLLDAKDFSYMPYSMPEPKDFYTPDCYKMSSWKLPKPIWIDNDGNTISFLEKYKVDDFFFNHWIFEESNHFGVIDKQGQIVIAPDYERYNLKDEHLVLLDAEKNLLVFDKNMNLAQDSASENVRNYFKSLYKDYKTLAQQSAEAQAALVERERSKTDPDNLAKYMVGEYYPFYYSELRGASFMSENVSGQGIFITRLDNNTIKIRINGSGTDFSDQRFTFKSEGTARIDRDLSGNATLIQISGADFTGTYDMLSKELKVEGRGDFGKVVNLSSKKVRSYEY